MRDAPRPERKRIGRVFEDTRLFGTATKGSHVRMMSVDGRYTTVPVHAGEVIPKGLLRKIIREDLEMTLEEFSEAYRLYSGK